VKKTVILFLIILVFLFPPLSVYFAVRSTVELRHKELLANRSNSVRSDMTQIETLSDESYYLIREQTRICRNFRMMSEKVFKERVCNPDFISAQHQQPGINHKHPQGILGHLDVPAAGLALSGYPTR